MWGPGPRLECEERPNIQVNKISSNIPLMASNVVTSDTGGPAYVRLLGVAVGWTCSQASSSTSNKAMRRGGPTDDAL